MALWGSKKAVPATSTKGAQPKGPLAKPAKKSLPSDLRMYVQLNLPATAKLAHVVADTTSAIWHYVDQKDGSSVAVAESVVFDVDGHVTDQRKLEAKTSDPEAHLAVPRITANGELGSASSNRATVVEFFAWLREPKKAAIGGAKLFHPDFCDRTLDIEPGAKAFLEHLSALDESGRLYDPHIVVAEGDMVAAVTAIGTPQPDGKQVFSSGFDLFRLDGGKLIDRWRINY